LGGAIALLLVACTPPQRPSTSSPSAASPSGSSAPRISPSPIPLYVELDRPYERAVDRAASAVAVERTAVTQEDWKLAALKWQQAIDLLNQVPKGASNFGAARKLLPTYQQGLQRTQEFAKQAIAPSRVASRQNAAKDDRLFVTKGVDTAEEKVLSGTEAIAALNSQQIAFFNQQKRFAPNLTELGSDPKITTNSAYTLTTTTLQPTQAVSTATAKQAELLSYTGAVFAVKEENGSERLLSIVCATTTPAIAPPAAPQLIENQPKCSDDSTQVGK
jgi:Type IV pilin-like G and H, putative